MVRGDFLCRRLLVPERLFARILGREDVVEFLELVVDTRLASIFSRLGLRYGRTDSAAPSFWDQMIHYHCLEEAPEHQDDVRFPMDG